MSTETLADKFRKGLRIMPNGDTPRRDEPPPEQPPPQVETFTAAALMTETIPEQRWAVDGVLPDGCSLAAGRSKIGKSWLAYNLALAVAQGGVALSSIETEGGDVLYLALEDTKKRLQSRISTILSKQDATAPERLTLAIKCPRADQGGLAFIHDWLEKHKEARLVIIDTWQKFKRQRRFKADPYEADYADASEIKAMADQHGVAVLIIHHCRKMAASDPLDEVLGSMGLTGAVDNVLVLRRDRGQHDATLHIMGRDVEERELALQWSPEYGLWSIMGDAEAYRVSNERQQLIDILRTEGKPMTPSEVKSLLPGKSLDATKQLLRRTALAGQIKNLGGGLYTCAHEESPESPQSPSHQSHLSHQGEDSHIIFPPDAT